MRSLLLTMAGALCVCGCANTSPDWDKRFGDASRNLRASQVIDPNAPSRSAGVAGVDGKAAAGAMKAYAESYGYAVKETKQPAITLNTNVGGR